MKQIPFLLLITIGMVACALSSQPRHVEPAPEPAPAIEKAPEVAKVTPDCKCDVCKCVDCICKPEPKPEAKVELPVSVKLPAANPVTRTTYGQQYSSCGPNGCGPARSFRIFRGRR